MDDSAETVHPQGASTASAEHAFMDAAAELFWYERTGTPRRPWESQSHATTARETEETLLARHLSALIRDAGWTKAAVPLRDESLLVRELLGRKAWDPAWKGVFFKLVVLLPDPASLIKYLFESSETEASGVSSDWLHHRLALAAECVSVAIENGRAIPKELTETIAITVWRNVIGWGDKSLWMYWGDTPCGKALLKLHATGVKIGTLSLAEYVLRQLDREQRSKTGEFEIPTYAVEEWFRSSVSSDLEQQERPNLLKASEWVKTGLQIIQGALARHFQSRIEADNRLVRMLGLMFRSGQADVARSALQSTSGIEFSEAAREQLLAILKDVAELHTSRNLHGSVISNDVAAIAADLRKTISHSHTAGDTKEGRQQSDPLATVFRSIGQGRLFFQPEVDSLEWAVIQSAFQVGGVDVTIAVDEIASLLNSAPELPDAFAAVESIGLLGVAAGSQATEVLRKCCYGQIHAGFLYAPTALGRIAASSSNSDAGNVIDGLLNDKSERVCACGCRAVTIARGLNGTDERFSAKIRTLLSPSSSAAVIMFAAGAARVLPSLTTDKAIEEFVERHILEATSSTFFGAIYAAVKRFVFGTQRGELNVDPWEADAMVIELGSDLGLFGRPEGVKLRSEIMKRLGEKKNPRMRFTAAMAGGTFRQYAQEGDAFSTLGAVALTDPDRGVREAGVLATLKLNASGFRFSAPRLSTPKRKPPAINKSVSFHSVADLAALPAPFSGITILSTETRMLEERGKKVVAGVTERAEELLDVVAPKISDKHKQALADLIADAQKEQIGDKERFVRLVNNMLDAMRLRIQLESGELARLRVIPAPTGNYIQFGLIGGSGRGGFPTAKFKLVEYADKRKN